VNTLHKGDDDDADDDDDDNNNNNNNNNNNRSVSHCIPNPFVSSVLSLSLPPQPLSRSDSLKTLTKFSSFALYIITQAKQQKQDENKQMNREA
jgi:hypothetical protein